MLITRIKVSNFYGIKDPIEVIFTEGGKKEKMGYKNIGKERVSLISGFYGANAAGKSTILHAIDSIIRVILARHQEFVIVNGVKVKQDVVIALPNFSTEMKSKPIELEMDFIIDTNKYKYSVSLVNEGREISKEVLDKNSKNQLTSDPFSLLEIVYNRYRQITGSVVRIGPHRERPDRVTFVNPNDKSTFVGSQGENVMSIINQISRKQINELNEWCKLLGIPYNLTRKRFKQFNISQLILKDEEGMSVSLADVGYGIGQVLPIILTSMLTRNTIITIEQPELHLHPKLQANLADLFIRSASTLNNNFILETHSEHIILRMKRRQKEARETRLDQGIKKQKSSANTVFELNQKPRYRSFPSNIGDFEMAKWISIRDSVVISVIDTPKNKSESEFSKITLNSGGDFDTHWPGDFFPERYKELGLEDDF